MNSKKQIFYALFVMLLWGSLFPMVKLGFNAYNLTSTGDIMLFAGVRFVICGVVISLYAFVKDKHSYVVAKKSLFPILMVGVFAIILHYSFTYAALTMTDSSKTAILKQIGALFYVCFSFLFFKDDKLNVRKFFGAILGFAGIVAINSNVKGVSFNMGDVFIIAASFCTVFSNVISKNVYKTADPVTTVGISQVFGGIFLVVIGAFLGGGMDFKFNAEALILIYICIASSLSYCIWNIILEKGELSKLLIIKFAEPLFACVFGAIILGENIFKIQYLLAFLLIAGGIYISNNKKNK